MTKDEIGELMRKLIDLGEDQGELNMWHKLYDILPEEDQTKLILNLQKELEELQALEK